MGRTRIDPAWQAWVAENLALGATLAEVRSALEEEGVSKSDATRVIKAVSDNPLFAGFVRERRMRARRDQVLALTERLRRTATIARRRTPSAEEFFSRFYATSTPCIFTDFTEGWAARDWTPSWLRETLRGVPVEIQSGRSADPAADRNLDQHRETTTMDAYVDRVLAAGATNDIYTVANNKNMDRPAFRRLLDDVVFRPDYFVPGHIAGGTSFWFGPAGTTTSFHHDTTNILFHQMYGRKRFVLATPTQAALLDEADAFYSKLDPDDASFREAHHAIDVVLSAGETLFLPVGYWHKVVALDVSISFSQLNLQRPNAFTEYAPGGARLF